MTLMKVPLLSISIFFLPIISILCYTDGTDIVANTNTDFTDIIDNTNNIDFTLYFSRISYFDPNFGLRKLSSLQPLLSTTLEKVKLISDDLDKKLENDKKKRKKTKERSRGDVESETE
ncbi:hypothetical protein RhiirB3_386586 [Rhizophagus irregularis]|nr:hypothetical protein RhiirB3_386586 [Rhizophagus irregularis]